MEIDLEKIRKEKPIKELLDFSIINIDKPAGPTSFGVDEFINKSLEINKSSHAGTLDPAVTGVLPVLLGRACKLLGYFMGHNKTYVGIMRLHEDIDDKKIENEMKKFVGKIKQTPPVKSRVKREERERQVYKWEILERDGKDVLFEVECEAGTYIRKLCSDLGEKIGGAHMLELRRIKASIFEEKESWNLYDFDKAVTAWKKGDGRELRKILIPAEIISKVLPVVQVQEESLKRLWNGSPLFPEFLKEKFELETGKKFAVFCKDRFIGIYVCKKDENTLAIPDYVLKTF
jgi:H/ACA ribonucleoprotein complex subunit 4